MHEKTDADEKIVKIEMSQPKFCELDGLIQRHYIDNNRTKLSNTYFSHTLNCVDWLAIPALCDADVINLHWVENMLSLQGLETLVSTGKPIVWTLHDQRPLTGGCHYTAGCEGFIDNNCHQCMQLKYDKFNLPTKHLLAKRAILQDANIAIVTPSKWLAEQARQSILFKDKPIFVVPNSVETEIFAPLNKRLAKEALGINPDAVVLMFGAQNANERRKGIETLLSAVRLLFKSRRYQELANGGKLAITLVGTTDHALTALPIPVHNFGAINDDKLLAQIYSASDVFLLPSYEDNLPNTMLEAMACGTPVIGFDIGGIPDLVRHNETGYLVGSTNYVALSTAINMAISQPQHLANMGVAAADLIRQVYTQKNQASAYLNLFERLPTVELRRKQRDRYKYEDLSTLFDACAPESLTQGK